jgi:hypothetical protein
MFAKLRKTKIYQIYYLIPATRHPFLSVFAYSLACFSVVGIIAFVEGAYRDIPMKEELEITRGTLLDVESKVRGGVLVVIADEETGEEVIFPNPSGSFPISGIRAGMLRKKVGRDAVLMWEYVWPPFGPLYKKKRTWDFEVDGHHYIIYKRLAFNKKKHRPAYRRIVITCAGILVFLVVLPWGLYGTIPRHGE